MQEVATRENPFEKVHRCVIAPIQSLWGGKTDEYTAKAYIDDLGRFSEDTLQKAMTALRRNTARKPALSAIIKECHNLTRPAAEGSGTSTKPPRLRHHQVMEVMRGDLGQEAIRDGWWWELFQHLSQSRTPEMTAEEISACQRASRAVWSDSRFDAEIERSPAEMREPFRGIWHAMQKRRIEVQTELLGGANG